VAKEEVFKYRVHEMAAAFPLPSADEYAAIKESVIERGFIYPKVFWRDGRGDVWLIDGRTRDRIESELLKAGTTEAKDGTEIKCRAAFFNGTEADAVRYVRALNMSRRAMTSGQKAAAAILCGDLYRRYKMKEEGKEAVEDAAEDEGDMATRVAKEAGTNRAYVFDCARLHRDHPDLLLEVLSGSKSIPVAKKVAARRSQGLPDEEPEGGAEPVEVAPEGGPDVMLDGLRNEVPDDLRSVFAFRGVVKTARKAINKALEDVKDAADGPGARNVSLQTVRADANNMVRHLDDHQPHAPCPYCSGTGKAGDAEQPDKKCGHCKGRRYLDRLQWKEVPAELRALYEKKPGQSDDDEPADSPAVVTAGGADDAEPDAGGGDDGTGYGT
jgi:hypothetical protein